LASGAFGLDVGAITAGIFSATFASELEGCAWTTLGTGRCVILGCEGRTDIFGAVLARKFATDSSLKL
jgi:hypothetical protein